MQESSTPSSSSQYGWIDWFCELKEHQFLLKVDQEYITDSFNLCGLKQMFQHYNQALEMILSPYPPEDQQLEDQKFLTIYQQATDIYGLIHKRYLTTQNGFMYMKEKIFKGVYGVCPRVLCQKQCVIPIGMSEQLRTSRVKVFCPRCQEVYMPTKDCHDIDSAYFGCSFANLLVLKYPELLIAPMQTIFIPKVYGFKIKGKKGSKYKQQKQKKQITFYTQQQLKNMKLKPYQKKQAFQKQKTKNHDL